MTTSPNIWRERYLELENTLEHILVGFADVLEKHEKFQSETQSSFFQIRRLNRQKEANQNIDLVYCVADGVNMEYSFTIFNGSNIIAESPFNRSNSFDLKLLKKQSFDKCRVNVKSHSANGPIELSKDLKL